MNERMTELAESFPTLSGRPGVRPWDPGKLLSWLDESPEVTHGSAHAARFVLAVWNGGITKFDAINALGTWDAAHRAAFLAWAESPFFP